MYIQLSDTDQFVTILATIEQLSNIWYKYNDSQSKYFKDLEQIFLQAMHN